VSSGFHDSVAVVKGALEHPHRVVSQVWSYRHPIADDLVPSGIIGIFEPLVVLPVLAVIVPNALNAFPGYIRLGFQNSPVYLLSALGTALLLARLAARTRGRNTLVVGVAAVVVGLGLFGDAHIAQHRQELWFSVTPQAAQQLAVVRAHTPDDAEIVMGPGVMGRFAGRSAAYLVQGFPQQIPVHAHDVEFVFAPYAGNQPLPLPGITTAERWAVDTLHARVLYSGSQVQAYSWTPPRGTKTVTLP